MAEKKRGTFLSTTKIDLIYGTDSQMNTTTDSVEFKKASIIVVYGNGNSM